MFFKKKINKTDNDNLVKIAALLIHAAKIDENYSDNEEEIIKKTLLKIGVKDEYLEKLLNDAKIMEKNSIQILDFTKEVKNMNNENKIEIIETLWRIIYSDKNADLYETSLMRKLAGLLYIDSKTMGNIKDKIKKENS
tara:strand:- start:837 stop:1250 length:414 start_codon:yes stop_codon:yes gene_type:complete